jgi:type IV pilus assembly protein PilQ
MKNFRRVGLLVVFAAVGVGCAIVVGDGINHRNDGDESRATGCSAQNDRLHENGEDKCWSSYQPAAQDRKESLPDVDAPRVAWEGKLLGRIEDSRGAEIIPAPKQDGKEVPKGAASGEPQSVRQWVSALPEPSAAVAAVSAAVNPRTAQEYVPAPPPEPAGALPGGKAGLPGVMKFLQDRLATPRRELPGAASTPSQTAKSQVKSTIEGEGDGKLRVHIYNEDIHSVLDLLSEQGKLNILASKNVEGKVSATLNGVDLDGALDAILKSTGYVAKRDGNYIFVGTPEDFNSLEQSLDRICTRVYRPNYITATELKTLITPLLSEKVGAISVSTPAEAGIGVDENNAGGNKFAGSEVVVVRDYEAVLTQIDQMVEEVDVRPLQVSIDAMILSVHLKDEDKFGVNFQFLRNNPNMKFGVGTPLDSLASFKLDEGGLKFGFLDTSLGTFINALEKVGDTNVVANPRLMVLNKHRADIQIGEQKGYLSSTVTETSTTYAVQFLDLGAQLRLRPFVSSDGIIRMEIHPELSDGDVKTENGVTLPNKTITQVTTNVMVKDGCTVIIGGLMRDQMVTSTQQVPFFGSLPLVGVCFRNTDETIERYEVLVLITPRIVYEPGSCEEGEKAACEYYRRHSTYADKMSPFGKRSIARRYVRLAQAAWADGDQRRALRFAEMAVQFDPLNRAAIDLRSDIWLGKQEGEHTVGAERRGGDPAANPLDGVAVAGWIMDDLENTAPSPPMPMHPYDRGVPGLHQDLERPTKLP